MRLDFKAQNMAVGEKYALCDSYFLITVWTVWFNVKSVNDAIISKKFPLLFNNPYLVLSYMVGIIGTDCFSCYNLLIIHCKANYSYLLSYKFQSRGSLLTRRLKIIRQCVVGFVIFLAAFTLQIPSRGPFCSSRERSSSPL